MVLDLQLAAGTKIGRAAELAAILAWKSALVDDQATGLLSSPVGSPGCGEPAPISAIVGRRAKLSSVKDSGNGSRSLSLDLGSRDLGERRHLHVFSMVKHACFVQVARSAPLALWAVREPLDVE